MSYVDKDKFAEAIINYPAIDEHSANAVISLLHRSASANVISVAKLTRHIAGHSYYHGDRILSRIICMSEGKEFDESIEPADVVEVVRCKECVSCKRMLGEQLYACTRQSAYKKPNDYCSYGIRRDAE